jgi:uroporphyrinogen decarboxylase
MDPVLFVEPEYIGPSLPKNTDVFGRGFSEVDYGTGVYKECVHFPLAQYQTLNEIKQNYKWPNPDWWDYSGISDQIKGFEDYPVKGGGSEPFLVYKDLRGHEQAFVDLATHPEIVHFCLEKLFALCYENTVRIYEQIPGNVQLSFVGEDFGSQQMLMYSPNHIREFFIPRMKRMIDLVHKAGAFVFFHSDGAIRDIIPDMVEAGVDVIDPIQWRCEGMDRSELKDSFGDKVIFHGAVDNQYTLAFGTVDEVRQEVVDNINLLGMGGGYIIGPCHNIQPISPPENIIAMYMAGLEYGWT